MLSKHEHLLIEQFELGNIIVKLCEKTPGGILVFFSSYYIMEEYIKEWTEKSIISEINKHKEFYQDRRDSKQNKIILEKYEKANSGFPQYQLHDAEAGIRLE